MFQNAATLWIEILVVVLVIGFLAALVGIHIYKKKHHLPTGECASCHKGMSRLVEDYHACYGKK